MTAVIEIRSRSFHRAGFGAILIPHPPVVSRLLRWGLPDDSYRNISAVHEFGHFQVLPFIAVVLLAVGTWMAMTQNFSVVAIAAILIGSHAAWEMLAEMYVRFHLGPLYSRTYNGVSFIPRIIFWSVAAALSVAGWVVA